MEDMLTQQNNLLLAQNMNMGGSGTAMDRAVQNVFYNPTTRASGENEFKLRWGGRKRKITAENEQTQPGRRNSRNRRKGW